MGIVTFQAITAGAHRLWTHRSYKASLPLRVILMLGKLNRVEHRTYLAIAGLVAVLFGIVISMGMAFQLGYFYTPLHGLLPFLALGTKMF